MRPHFAPILFCLALFAWPCAAEADAQTLKVGIFVNPPFVMAESGAYSGFAIDLWEQIAANLAVPFQYVEYPVLGGLLQDAENGAVDLVVTNLAANYERASALNLSFPWYDSGIRIMIREDEHGHFWTKLNRAQIYSYLAILLLLGAMTFTVTVIRRKMDREYSPSWLHGLSQSFHDVVAMAKRGNLSPKKLSWIEYILAGLWMIFGVAFIAYITSTITTAMTTASLAPEIESIFDLPGKRVGVLADSEEQLYLRRMGITCVGYDHLEEAVRTLAKGGLDAVVGEAPVLEYLDASVPGVGLRVVGELVHPEKYVFAGGPEQAELTKAVSLEIIRLTELDVIWKLRDKYFGNEDLPYYFR